MTDLASWWPTVLIGLGSGVLSVVVTLVTTRSTRASTEETARAKFREDLMAERKTLVAELEKVQAAHDKCSIDLSDVKNRLNSAEQHIAVLRGSNEVMEKWVVFFKEQMGPARVTPVA